VARRGSPSRLGQLGVATPPRPSPFQGEGVPGAPAVPDTKGRAAVPAGAIRPIPFRQVHGFATHVKRGCIIPLTPRS
jgi:hypothetical protein